MNTQPEALRLAHYFETEMPCPIAELNAAAELRRLHEENQALQEALSQHVDAVNMSQEYVDETAKGEHEPAAWMYEWLDEYDCWNKTAHLHKPDFLGDIRNLQPLYTATQTMPDDLIATYEKGFRDCQAKREWVGLEDEKLDDVTDEFYKGAVWAEVKLKEKNHG